VSTPPLGVGYPDGGEVVSTWGNPLVARFSQATTNGQNFFSGFVGNYKLLQYYVQSSVDTWRVTFTWYLDSAFTLLLGQTSVDIGGFDSNQLNGIMGCLGPYVKIGVNNSSLGTNTLACFVVPVDGVTKNPEGAASGQSFTCVAVVGAGATVSFFPQQVVAGPAVATGINMIAATGVSINFLDYNSVLVGTFGMSAPNNIPQAVSVTVPCVIPPMRVRIDLSNGTAAPNALRGAYTVTT